MHESEREVAKSCPTLSNPMDCSHQTSPSMGFSRQEYWSGVPLPSPLYQESNHELRIQRQLRRQSSGTHGEEGTS